MQQNPQVSFVIRPITFLWSVGLRQISCSFKPQAAESPSLIRVICTISVRFKNHLQSRVRLLIRALRVIRVRHQV